MECVVAFARDEDLMRKADAVLRHKNTDRKRRERINELINELNVAERLAHGPLTDRSEHWSDKAYQVQSRLRREIGE